MGIFTIYSLSGVLYYIMTQVYYCEEFEDSKSVIIIDKSKDRQHNEKTLKGKSRKDKPRSTNITHKTKDRITRTSLKSRLNSGGYDTSSLYYIMTQVVCTIL